MYGQLFAQENNVVVVVVVVAVAVVFGVLIDSYLSFQYDIDGLTKNISSGIGIYRKKHFYVVEKNGKRINTSKGKPVK